MNNRTYKWDNAKFVAIPGVVIGHMITNLMTHGAWPQYRSLFFFIYTFHMPVFLFLAGLMQRPFDKEDKLNTGKLMMNFRGKDMKNSYFPVIVFKIRQSLIKRRIA